MEPCSAKRAHDGFGLFTQDSGNDQAAIWPKRAPEHRQRGDQKFAEEVRGHDFVTRARFPPENIGGDELGPCDVIEPRVLAGVRDGAWIDVETENLAAPRRRAARARMPVPVPASSRRQPSRQFSRASSSRRSDIAVVACSPVPNAPAAGMIS